jgi:allophanate hydrolase subunit 2
VLLSDHQPTGGYTVIACVIRADVSLLAQRQPGDDVRFSLTTRSEAVTALAVTRAAHASIRHEMAWDDLRQVGR